MQYSMTKKLRPNPDGAFWVVKSRLSFLKRLIHNDIR
jgi:hypothetical protein